MNRERSVLTITTQGLSNDNNGEVKLGAEPNQLQLGMDIKPYPVYILTSTKPPNHNP